MKNLAVFVSGGGTNFQAIIDGIASGKINASIKLLISSSSEAFALERAKRANIPYLVYSAKHFPGTADEMYAQIAALIKCEKIDIIVLAGYIKVLPSSFVSQFKGKIVNTHPALIPKHCGKGMYGHFVHESVLKSGDSESGVTIHYVDEGVDTGTIIAQQRVPVLPDDTPDSLAARVLVAEHELFPQVIAELCK
ncbi:MAG: phosphoribosylglycinamide formyltransferase [Christensenellaceae bacterium]|jgi:phosphoribosylglycinamide formyltransferase-1|nr:phosphoribosylglycinamide formyltransferase [Christensenellaceae bacterium]